MKIIIEGFAKGDIKTKDLERKSCLRNNETKKRHDAVHKLRFVCILKTIKDLKI